MNKNEINFTTKLEKWIAKSRLSYKVRIYHKNNKLAHISSYFGGFSIDEIYSDINRKHPNKNYTLEIIFE